MRVPVQLVGLDASGNYFEEETYTEDVSKTGALVLTRNILQIGSTIQIRAFKKFESPAKVRMIIRDHRNADYFKLGIEFDVIHDAWVIH